MRYPTMLRALLAVVLAVGAACAGVGVTDEGSKQAGSEQPREGGASDALVDAGITARLKTTYLFNRHLDAVRINVSTENRHVTLEGAVSSDIQRDLAEAIAGNVEGVESVTNLLEVGEGRVDRPEEVDRTFTQAVADATTTASVKMALAFESGVKASEIEVDTRWGTVTLSGDVGSRAERTLAEKTAEDVSGVQEVINRIEVKS